jgi:hypothetical protein
MPEYNNYLIEATKSLGIEAKDGKFKLTPNQMQELHKAFGNKVASIFDANGNVYVPEHMIHTMILQNFESTVN